MFLWRGIDPRLLGRLVLTAAAAAAKSKRAAIAPVAQAKGAQDQQRFAAVDPVPPATPRARF